MCQWFVTSLFLKGIFLLHNFLPSHFPLPSAVFCHKRRRPPPYCCFIKPKIDSVTNKSVSRVCFVCESQMIVSLRGISARSMYHLLSPSVPPYTYTSQLVFVREGVTYSSPPPPWSSSTYGCSLHCCPASPLYPPGMTRILSFWSGKNSKTRQEKNPFDLPEKRFLFCFFPHCFFTPLLILFVQFLFFPVCPVQTVGLSSEAIPPCVNTS